MAGFTNQGKQEILDQVFRTTTFGTLPANYYVALVTSATAPTADTDTLGQLTEIAAGNGYVSGGIQLAKNSTDFDTPAMGAEDDTNDWGWLQIKDLTWTASGGPIPASGNGARYAVLTDYNATVASRKVYAFWDLVTDRSVSDTQSLTLQNCELRLTE